MCEAMARVGMCEDMVHGVCGGRVGCVHEEGCMGCVGNKVNIV